MSNRKRPKAQQKKARQQAPEPIDFDAIRAKRQRVMQEVPPVKIGGKKYVLAPSIPLAVTDYFAEHATRNEDGDVTVLLADMQRLLKVLFGEDQWAEISQKIDLPDVPVLFNTVFDSYKVSVGESSNSGQS